MSSLIKWMSMNKTELSKAATDASLCKIVIISGMYGRGIYRKRETMVRRLGCAA